MEENYTHPRIEHREYVIRFRGAIMEQVVLIEGLMQTYITDYFCKESKRGDFLAYVICFNLQYDKSREIFCGIISRDFKEINKKYKKELADLNRLSEDRNILAHYPIDGSDEMVKIFIETGELHFVKYKGGASKVVFTKEYIQEMYSNIKKIKIMFGEIHPMFKNSNED